MLDRYQLRKELHRGASGEVWLARERDTRELVVARLATTPAEIERVRREGSALGRASHEGVPRLIAQGPFAGGWCVVVEHVEGAQLGKVLRVTTPSPSRAAGWARQLASAVTHLHSVGVVHGDLHPDNVIVARDLVGRDRLVLVGFGLATVDGEAPPPLGKVQVAAPERVRGAPASPSADVYALGVVLYRMLTDRWPFAGSDSEVLAHHVDTPPPPFVRLAPDMRLPPGLERIVFRCLAKDGAERYGSAELLLQELRAVEFAPHRDWVRVENDPDSVPTPVPAPTSARRARSAWLGLAIGAMIALLAVWWWGR